jgi:tRNA(adenine34) deaminase
MLEKGDSAVMNDRFYLELAMQEAERAALEGTFPVGAVIVGPDGQILSKGRNRVYTDGDYTAHAEVVAIREAGSLLMQPENRHRSTLYTTMEPCLMCTVAFLFAYITRVVWVLNDDLWGGLRCELHHPPGMTTLKQVERMQAPEPDLLQRMEELIELWTQNEPNSRARWKEL